MAITIIDIAGAAGNDAVGVPSPAEQQRDWQQIADSINASGGAACRKLALHFFSVNPLSTDGANRSCLDIAASNPFIVLDTGALTQVSASDCVPSAKIPLVSAYVSEDQLKKYYPYYLSPLGTQADGYRTNYKGAVKNGYFSASKGFKKLGIMFRTCRKGLVDAGRAAIRAAGIPDSATVTYSLGCTPGGTAATDFQQAAVTFKRAGVTHVTHIDENNYAQFTQAAAQQGYKPQYVVAQDQDANKTTGAYAPNAANLDGALAVIGGRYGEQDTPGYPPSAGTARCNAVYAKFNQKPVYQQGAGYGGVVCTYLWFVSKALDHVTQLQRSAVVSGMRGIGTLDAAFPFGPIDYTALPAGTPYGKESYRVDRYSKDCSCWKVLDRTFRAAP